MGRTRFLGLRDTLIGTETVAQIKSPDTEGIGAGALGVGTNDYKSEVQVVTFWFWVEGKLAVVLDGGTEVVDVDAQVVGLARLWGWEVAPGEGIKGKVGVLGHELVGGGGQGSVEGGEDAELGREGQLVRGGPQERLVVLGGSASPAEGTWCRRDLGLSR